MHQQQGDVQGTPVVVGGAPVPPPRQAAGDAPRNHRAGEAEEDPNDLFASPPGLWLPRTVVKKHRKKATLIWVLLLTGFLTYVWYITWQSLESRKEPASSIELKQEYYTFPDVAICTTYLEGCLDPDNDCLYLDPVVSFTSGFEEDGDTTDFVEDNADSRTDFILAYPHCRVVPFSRLTVNETAVNSGDVNAFHAAFWMLWDEVLEDEFAYVNVNQQDVQVYFINVDEEVENLGEEVVDAKIPYARVNLTADTTFVATTNHMVLGLTEFTGINANGDKQERQRTFSQSTTSTPMNWLWTDDGASGYTYAFLFVEMSIGKFEYTSIEEVDPVDLWSILGAIGGIWQFVVTGFGLFFVFSVKQAPDRKMRSFAKSIRKPVQVVQRFSVLSARSSVQEDSVVDSSEEDLPVGWVKKQKAGGSIYYHNELTGEKQTHCPHHLGGATAGAPQPRPHTSALRRVFQPEHNSSGASAAQDSSQAPVGRNPLPHGWVAATNDEGRIYYMNTANRMSQWDRPMQDSSTQQRGAFNGGPSRRPQVDELPRRGSNASSFQSHGSTASGEPSHHRDAASVSTSAAGPPAAGAPAPPLGSTPSAPSYNTALHLPNSSTSAAEAAAARGGDSNGGGSAAAGSDVGATLPPGWERRVDGNNKTYYANRATHKTQWKAPRC